MRNTTRLAANVSQPKINRSRAFPAAVEAPVADRAPTPHVQRHRFTAVSALPPQPAPVGNSRVNSVLASDKNESRANHAGLPDELKAGAETLSGLSLDDVQVHYNSAKPATVQALAYTQGAEIHIAPGQERHLPHEAWHAVQQMQGRVQPTLQLKDGVSVNNDPGLEHEADAMGEKASASAGLLRSALGETGFVQVESETVRREGHAEEASLQRKSAAGRPSSATIQLQGGLLEIPGKKPHENYLGWGGWRVAKELVSKGAGLKRGAGSMIGGLGRQLGYDLPNTYPNTTVAGMAPELQAALVLAKANSNAIPAWLLAGQRRPVGGNYVPGAAIPGQLTYTTPHRNQYQNKFGSTYFNEDGSLPGVKGAGGYKEYYAQPAPGPCQGDWGSNRILRQTNDPTGTYYWATDDHYQTFRYIKDA